MVGPLDCAIAQTNALRSHPNGQGWAPLVLAISDGARLDNLRNLSAKTQARSKRSVFITLVQAATKSATNFASASSAP